MLPRPLMPNGVPASAATRLRLPPTSRPSAPPGVTTRHERAPASSSACPIQTLPAGRAMVTVRRKPSVENIDGGCLAKVLTAIGPLNVARPALRRKASPSAVMSLKPVNTLGLRATRS